MDTEVGNLLLELTCMRFHSEPSWMYRGWQRDPGDPREGCEVQSLFGPLVGLSETQSFKASITDNSSCWEMIKQVSSGFHNQVSLCRWWRRWWTRSFYLFTEKRNSFSPSFFSFSHTFMLYCWKRKYWNMERGRKRGKMKRRKEKERNQILLLGV